MIDPLEIGNVGTVSEKLRQAHVAISAEQESQGYQGDQQIQEKTTKNNREGKKITFVYSGEKACQKGVQTPQKVQ